MLGVDIYFASLVENLIYFSSKQKNYYAFLTDMEGTSIMRYYCFFSNIFTLGRVIVHPKFASLSTVKQRLQFLDISYFEKVPLFHMVKNRLLTEPEGVQMTKQFGLPVITKSMLKFVL